MTDELLHVSEGRVPGTSFSARAVYAGPDARIRGVRLVHDSGMPVDLFQFQAAPGASICVNALPRDDRGAGHASEHLLVGKGSRGRALNAMVEARFGTNSAETHADRTCYHFRAASELGGFLDVLRATFQALLVPDFTDEEARREVAHLEPVVQPDGSVVLEEKGAVYNEMLVTADSPNEVAWQRLKRLMFGAGHPLAHVAGGTPAGLRALQPADIRSFHAQHYVVGPGMGLILTVPPKWPLASLLKPLGEMLASAPPPRTGRRTSKDVEATNTFNTAPASVEIVDFAGSGADVSQQALVAWKPLRSLELEDSIGLDLLLYLLAGDETSYLHRDLIDGSARTLDSGATGVSGHCDSGPLWLPVIGIYGLPGDSISKPRLEALRRTIQRRVAWLAGLADNSSELEAVAEKALAYVDRYKRDFLVAFDEPPKFGDPSNNDAGWHRYLELLDRSSGSRRAIWPADVIGRIREKLRRGENVWAPLLRASGMIHPGTVVATRPSADLVSKRAAAKQARLARALSKLKTEFHAADSITALQRFRARYDANTSDAAPAVAGAIGPTISLDPPLLLDDAPFFESRIADTIPAVTTQFNTMTATSMQVAFSLNSLSPQDWELLPVLLATVGEVGVTTDSGKSLDYVETRERLGADLHGFSVSPSMNPSRKRAELLFQASAATPDEIGSAATWLETFVRRPNFASSSVQRIFDVVRTQVQALRGLLQQDDNGWLLQAGLALIHQNDGAYLSVSSPFTALYHLSRAQHRLLSVVVDPAQRDRNQALLQILTKAVSIDSRSQVRARLTGEAGDLAEFLRFELAGLPEETWRADMARLVAEARADLQAKADDVVAGLQRLLRKIAVQGGTRVALTGNAASSRRASDAIAVWLRQLPRGDASPGQPLQSPIQKRLQTRLGQTPSGFLAWTNEASVGATIAVRAPGPSYYDANPTNVTDRLALGLFSGRGPSSVYMRIWASGLAYSSGLGVNSFSGSYSLYAERCPDPVATLRFVESLAADPRIDEKTLEASIADSFADQRTTWRLAERGSAIAENLADGLRPEMVRTFRAGLLRQGREASIAGQLRQRIPSLFERLIVKKGAPIPGTKHGEVALVLGPDPILKRLEKFVNEVAGTRRFWRIYRRDFWPDAYQ